jgi:glycosyltransferase involved in cell wall biosynthesis
MTSAPRVSVVIPTFARPELVKRAVRSALAQTVADIEVVVVIDGPDAATLGGLAEIADDRLRVISLTESGGAQRARNAGIAEAQAPWTAMLDDDDEWMPTKLAVQLELARNTAVPMPIIATRLAQRTPRAELIMPRRVPAPGEPLSEYLTVRRGLFHGEGFIQTSTIMARTELLRRVPFAQGVRRMQELDWTLRALSQEDVDLVYSPEALVLWHADENRPRISSHAPWQAQFDWLVRSRSLMTPRAYAALMTSVISSMAAPTRSLKVAWALLREARRNGQPKMIDYLTFAQIWLIPPSLRRGLRDRILKRGRANRTAAIQAAGPSATGSAAIPLRKFDG